MTQSSVQAEGAGAASDWFAWERERELGPSSDGNGFGTDFADDFALFASLGHTHVRLTIEWARIEPAGGKLDRDEIDRYHDMLTAARHAGLDPIVTLVSTSLPGWFHDDEGGFLDAKNRRTRWVTHVERCAETFEGLAAAWVGIDDPIGWAVRGYGLGSRPPGRNDPEKAIDAVVAALDADRLAATVLRAGTAPVISSFGLPTIFPVGPDAGASARFWDDLFWQSWIGAVGDGEVLVPHRRPRKNQDYVGMYDIVGFIHMPPLGVDREGTCRPYPGGGQPDATGFVPTPPELGETLRRLDEELPNQPLLVTGLGVTTDDDDFRDAILDDMSQEIASAIGDGVALKGWLHDTGVDGYEWAGGFTRRRGIIDRDRNPKPSARRVAAPDRPDQVRDL